jgi:hypothetical protein
VSNLLFRAIFVDLKVVLPQATDNSRSLFFEHQRVDSHQIDIDFDDFCRELTPGRVVGRIRLV